MCVLCIVINVTVSNVSVMLGLSHPISCILTRTMRSLKRMLRVTVGYVGI